MTPVVAKVVFLTTSALGTASLGSTAYFVEHPRVSAQTPVVEREITPVARPLPPAPVAITEPPMVLEPVTVTGTRAPVIRTKAAPTRRAAPAKAKELNPCTGWRDMGPTNIDNGEGSVRRVRTLCLGAGSNP